MNLTPLKYLLFIENVTCVFRNYYCIKKCTRIFGLIWMWTELINISSNVVSDIQRHNNFNIKAQRVYYFSVAGFSVYIMIASLYYSKRFYKLLLNFDGFYKIFDDVIYNRRLARAQKIITSMVVSFCSIKIFVFAIVRMYEGDHGMGFIAQTVNQYNIALGDFRYIFQYFILYSILFITSEQLRATTRSIEKEIAVTRDVGRVVVNQERLNKINKWVQAYESINSSSNLCNSIFSVQLTIMLLILTAYYIILLYSIAIATVEKGPNKASSLFMNSFSMIVFLMALFVISRAGQKVQNSSLQLRQKLCELCVHSLENEQYYKLAKDLLRCVRTRPVRVHVFGTLNVDMSLLPSVVAFFTSYTVIALQFNNVL